MAAGLLQLVPRIVVLALAVMFGGFPVALRGVLMAPRSHV